MTGIIVLDKPAEITSFKAAKKVKSILNAKKAGHTGTLDPFATGVLVICLNSATRLVPYLQQGEKTYIARLCLGEIRDTYDKTGNLVERRSIGQISDSEIAEVLKQFTGTIMQTPPIFSAIKIDGQRLYVKARKGETVIIPPRNVSISALKLIEFNLPWVTIEVVCSKGTYIRTLAHDIGLALGCGAYLEDLRRTGNGAFSVSQAATFEQLQGNPEKYFVSLEEVTKEYLTIQLNHQQEEKICHGCQIFVATGFENCKSNDVVRAITEDNKMRALGQVSNHIDGGFLFQPKIVFHDN